MEITSKSYLSLYLIVKTGNVLKKHGYDIKVFNTINFSKSIHIIRRQQSMILRTHMIL